jgi:hypothetical protein
VLNNFFYTLPIPTGFYRYPYKNGDLKLEGDGLKKCFSLPAGGVITTIEHNLLANKEDY